MILPCADLNCALYTRNKDFRRVVSLVPTSAITGEGVPDLLMLLVQLTQSMMSERLMYISELQCTILEVCSDNCCACEMSLACVSCWFACGL